MIFIDFIFKRSYRFTEESRGKYSDFLYTPVPHVHRATIKISHQCYICYNQWTDVDTSLSPKVHSLHYGSLLVMGFDKCMMTGIHHDSII